MSEILDKRLKASVGKNIILFIKETNFRYRGKITGYDGTWLEILDSKTNAYKVFLLDEIKEFEVENG